MLRVTNVFDLIKASDAHAITELIKNEPAIVNSLDSSGRTVIQALLDKVADISIAESPDQILAQIDILRCLINQDHIDITVLNKDNKSLSQLFSQTFYGCPFESYREVVDVIINKDPHAIKNLFFNAVYANNLDMVKHLLKIDMKLIHAIDTRGFSAYKVSVASSATDVENYFYESFGEEIKNEGILNIDLSHPQTVATILKAAISYENPEDSIKIGLMLDELYNNLEFRPTMNLVAASLLENRGPTTKPIRIFVSDSDNVRSLTPKSKGHGDYDYMANVLRIGIKRKQLDIKGTLIHELTHLAAQLTYNNETKPYIPKSTQEDQYKKAIKELEYIYTTRENLHKDESKISELLVQRMGQYSAKEDRLNLPPGSLTEPEYIVSIPQGIVQLATYYDDANTSSLISRGMPMYQYWRDVYNSDVSIAFESHPKNELVDTTATIYSETPTRKNILTASIDGTVKVLMGTKFDRAQSSRDLRYTPEDDQFIGQYRLTNQLIMSKIFSGMTSDKNMPIEINLTQANNLIKDDIFINSKEFQEANLAVFLELTNIWKKRKCSPGNGLTLNDLSKDELKLLEGKIPKELTQKIDAVLKEWKKDATNKHITLSKAVENCLKEYVTDKNIHSVELKKLSEEITNQLYSNLPSNVDPKMLNFPAILPNILLASGVLQIDTSSKKTPPTVTLGKATLNKEVIQDIASSPKLYQSDNTAEVKRRTSDIFQCLGISRRTSKAPVATASAIKTTSEIGTIANTNKLDTITTPTASPKTQEPEKSNSNNCLK